MYGILIAIAFIYYIRYRVAKGSGRIEEFKEQVAGRMLWLMTCTDIMWIVILFVYGTGAPYYWEAVMLIVFMVLTNPLFLRISLKSSPHLTVIIPC